MLLGLSKKPKAKPTPLPPQFDSEVQMRFWERLMSIEFRLGQLEGRQGVIVLLMGIMTTAAIAGVVKLYME